MHKFTISNEMEKIIIEKWTRLCTSCRNNAIHIQPNRVRNWIFSHAQADSSTNPTTEMFICSRKNTLVWIFYGLQENDGTVNCVVRRSKLQTKEHFKKGIASDRLTNDVCLCFFLSICRALWIACFNSRSGSSNSRSSSMITGDSRSGKAYKMQKKTSLKIIVFLNIFCETSSFHSFICLKKLRLRMEQAW